MHTKPLSFDPNLPGRRKHWKENSPRLSLIHSNMKRGEKCKRLEGKISSYFVKGRACSRFVAASRLSRSEPLTTLEDIEVGETYRRTGKISQFSRVDGVKVIWVKKEYKNMRTFPRGGFVSWKRIDGNGNVLSNAESITSSEGWKLCEMILFVPANHSD